MIPPQINTMAEEERQEVIVVESSTGLVYINIVEEFDDTTGVFVDDSVDVLTVGLVSEKPTSPSTSDSFIHPPIALTEVQSRIEALLEANSKILDNERLLRLKSRPRGTRKKCDPSSVAQFEPEDKKFPPQCSAKPGQVQFTSEQSQCLSGHTIEPPEQEANLKSIFTWEFLDQTLQREWEEGEREAIENLIKEGDDEQIVNLLFGTRAFRRRQCAHCFMCIQGSDFDYAAHWEVSHVGEKLVIECEYCGTVSGSFDQYHAHWQSHLREYKCYEPGCFKIFRSRRALAIHKPKHKSQANVSYLDPIFTLPKKNGEDGSGYESCDENEFQGSGNVTNHQNVEQHAGDSYSCTTCNKTFSRLSGLKNHQLSQHVRNPSSFMCDVCGKRYQSKQSLKSHMSTHTDLQFSCSVCGATFKMLRSCKSHERRHRETKKPATFRCNQCPKVFVTRSQLKQHLDVHAVTKAYACSSCGKQYKLRKSCLAHMRTHTSSATEH